MIFKAFHRVGIIAGFDRVKSSEDCFSLGDNDRAMFCRLPNFFGIIWLERDLLVGSEWLRKRGYPLYPCKATYYCRIKS